MAKHLHTRTANRWRIAMLACCLTACATPAARTGADASAGVTDAPADLAASPPDAATAVDASAPADATAPVKDADGDGWCAGSATGCPNGNGDCDDHDPAVHPSAQEVCNGVDDDCNGWTDDGIGTVWYDDADGDGWGDPGPGVLSMSHCASLPGHATQADDCDDSNPLAHPGAVEVCDGIDNDCNGNTDEGCIENVDQDGDGACDANVLCLDNMGGCPGGCGDCNDSDALVFPAMPEACDGVDNNCNGKTDEGCPATCGDGVCETNETIACVSDCSALWPHYGGPCTKPLTWQDCPHGYVCVPRQKDAVCVADFDTWTMLPDEITPAAAFQVHAGYFVQPQTGLWWARQPAATLPWTDLAVACADLDLGGKQDWHMPTMAEVLSLSGLTQNVSFNSWPMAKPSISHPKSAVPGNYAGSMWMAAFWDGDSFVEPADFTALGSSTYCVRSSAPSLVPPKPEIRFLLEPGGKTVLDLLTGLHWQTNVSPMTLAWQEAKNICTTNLAGLPGTGWRMPTGHELLTLVDRQAGPPTIDPIFPTTPEEKYWTTAVQTAANPAAFVVDFKGGAGHVAVTDVHLVRCVR